MTKGGDRHDLYRDAMIEAGGILLQVCAVERDAKELYGKAINEEFFYAGLALIKAGDVKE